MGRKGEGGVEIDGTPPVDIDPAGRGGAGAALGAAPGTTPGAIAASGCLGKSDSAGGIG
jgi:hypothetical protein